MPETFGTALARLKLILLDEAERLGADRSALIRAAGLSPRVLEDPDARLPVRWSLDLWEAIVRALPRPDLGVEMGRSRALRDLGLVGYTMLHSPTLAIAFERLQRYGRIVSEAVDVRVETDADRLTLEFRRNPAFERLRQPVDYTLARVVAAARELTGVAIVPAETRFAYPEGPRTAAHRDLFGAHVVLGADRPGVTFHASDAARPVVAAEGELGQYLDRLAEQTLAEIPDRRTFVGQVRRSIWDRFDGTPPTLDEVADELGFSPRSLQRRLAERGTSFATLRDEMRREMATRLLAGHELSIQEIGYLLGYADPSAFHRAFRRWEGVAPKHFRDAVWRMEAESESAGADGVV